ncbi:LLM class flavin-dependent oxidoreductase [Beggiatoa leptomitoformis]|uniref:LLM class flavin-dependent oxidoreductase n=1 Tax=Beggiatoa leptomitoformis TaxID=288004 RepID=A0A2N9YEC9_9GAMM|nr:LLM class flavin-dependent oxidoreductase [Beggiatoa leptomitoformis]ALG68837.1 LLM class flavin-dependent oxidoreductase [Beggiatoa leptomitoformis]AUI68796.1 LLM class flavin-dependent oxidoreductase [Beggiatoa leptomitoformis]
MRCGIFCFFENWHNDFRLAYQDQFALLQYADELGFNEAWLAEHHFNATGASPSIFPLLTHGLAITRQIQVGAAAILLPFHHPIQVAEDLATIDLLSDNRLLVGVARGGPFPLQNKHFGVSENEARGRLLECLALVESLLYQTNVTFSGQYYQAEEVTIYPRPQRKIPFYLATGSENGVRYAAEQHYGVMGGQPWSLDKLQEVIQQYRHVNASGSDKFTVLRAFYVAPTREEAYAIAQPMLNHVAGQMRHYFQATGNPLQMDTPQLANRLLENAIVGSVVDCREKLRHLKESVQPQSVVLRPAAQTLTQGRHCLRIFKEEVLPYV